MGIDVQLVCEKLQVCRMRSYTSDGSGIRHSPGARHPALARGSPLCRSGPCQHFVGEGTRISVDETSARRGHRYVTNVLDAETHDLLLMVEGRSAEALEAFAQALVIHGGKAQQIELISMDMSPAYQSGASRFFREPRSSSIAFILCKWLAKPSIRSVRKWLAKEPI